jgi:hypothetical protein
MFSSSEAIDHLDALAPGADWRAGRALASHPRIAERAQALGFGAVIVVAHRRGVAAASHRGDASRARAAGGEGRACPCRDGAGTVRSNAGSGRSRCRPVWRARIATPHRAPRQGSNVVPSLQ